MTVRTPFNFARIPRKVWEPSWGNLVSHDVPFADGWSGHITLEIEAKTELLIGGPRRKTNEAAKGEVWPVQLPDGTYAIPPSALQGMIRSVLEIISFAKLGPWVDDRRFAVRDIGTNATGRKIYAARMTEPGRNGTQAHPFEPRTRTGWLIKNGDGCKIIPCQMSRIHVDNIVALAPAANQEKLRAELTCRADAKERIKAWDDLGPGNSTITITAGASAPQRHSGNRYIHYSRATLGGHLSATLVLTGKSQRGTNDRQKKWDFAFHTPDRATAASAPGGIDVPADVWRDFQIIHAPPKGNGQKENPNWTVWKGDFERGQPVPIFYIETVDASDTPAPNTVSAMGTAFMFKLAQTNSTHQMLANSADAHIAPQSALDLPSLIFGAIEGEERKPGFQQSLKRRASFGWATPSEGSASRLVEPIYAGNTNQERKDGYAPAAPADATVLLGPKPSYYPVYVRQRATSGNTPYASYTPIAGAMKPELAGTKIWPATGKSLFNAMPRAPTITGDRRDRGKTNSQATQVHLHAIAPGARFTTRLYVHNLRTIELQALLWALTFGEQAAIRKDATANTPATMKRHRIGIGKPYGLGEIAVSVSDWDLVANDPEEAQPDLTNWLHDFPDAMTKAMECTKPWQDSAQVKAVIAAATPDQNRKLGYMPLQNADDSYVTNRGAGNALKPLADDGWEDPGPVETTPAPVPQPQHNHGGHNGNHQGAPPPRNIRPERGCRVRRNADNMLGTLGREQYGVWHVDWDNGTSGDAPVNSFTVISGPDD